MKLQKYTINVISKFSDSSMGVAKVIATSEEQAVAEVAKFYLERYSFEKSDLIWKIEGVEEVKPEVIEFK